MPPIVLTVIGILQLAIKYAPEAEKIYAKARELISMWFAGGTITVEQQAILMGWADAHQIAVLKGTKPPELEIDPDPVDAGLMARQRPGA